MFPRPFLHKLHCVMGLSPRQISELHRGMFGFTIWPHGVRNYLRAYGIFEPRTRGKGSNTQLTENKEIASLLEKYRSSQKTDLANRN